jgi:putative colanic acid biosynthesis acetyltransferase WcaF
MISQALQNSQIDQQPPEQHFQPFVDLSKYDQSSFDRGRPGWFILLWWFIQAVIFPLTPHSFSLIRRAILRLFGAKIGKNVLIRPTARFTYPWKVIIGDHSWIGDDVVIYSIDRVNIGNHCVISQKSYLCTGSHNIKDPTFALQTASITIEDGAWVAADCFVAAGVTISANAVIGARSSVFGNMPPGQVCMGSPCRPRFARKMNQIG